MAIAAHLAGIGIGLLWAGVGGQSFMFKDAMLKIMGLGAMSMALAILIPALFLPWIVR